MVPVCVRDRHIAEVGWLNIKLSKLREKGLGSAQYEGCAPRGGLGDESIRCAGLPKQISMGCLNQVAAIEQIDRRAGAGRRDPSPILQVQTATIENMQTFNRSGLLRLAHADPR